MIRYTLDLYNNFEWFTPNGENYVPQISCGNAIPPDVGGQAGCSPLYGDQFHQRDDRVYAGGSASRTYTIPLCRPADRDHVRHPDPLRRHQPRPHRHLSAHLHRQYPHRQGRRRQRRHLRREHDPLDQLVPHHARLARRLFRGQRHLDLRRGSIPATPTPRSAARRPPWWSAPSTRRSSFSAPAWAITATTSAAPPSPNIRSTASPSPSITSSPIGRRRRCSFAPAAPRPGSARKPCEGLDSSVSVFFLDQASELVFEGDLGDTEAGRASERYGVEFTNDYRPHLVGPFRRQSRALPRAVPRLRLRSGDNSISRFSPIRRSRSAMPPATTSRTRPGSSPPPA